MSQPMILYDLPSAAPYHCWSGNVWKTRLALNFKNLPYETKWVPLIHIQETVKATGVKPHPPGGWSEYSVPTIKLPGGSFVMDSAEIAVKLESMYPQPSLHLNPDLEKEAQDAIGKVFWELALYLIPPAVSTVVAEEDMEYFKTNRAERFGLTVEQLLTPKDADKAYAAAKPALEKCRELLRQHKKDQGPFILGSEPSYADFYLVSTMAMINKIGREVFQKFLREAGPEMTELYEACKKWTVKDT